MEEDLAGRDHARPPEQAEDCHRQGRLAATALAGEPQHVSAPEDQVAVHDRVNSFFTQAVIHAEPPDLEDRVRNLG